MEDVEEMIIASKPSTTAKRSAKVGISFAFLFIRRPLSLSQLSSLLTSIGSFTGVPVNHKNKSALCTCLAYPFLPKTQSITIFEKNIDVFD